MNKSFLIADVKAVDTDDPAGGFEAVISAPTLDRDGEVIDAGAFQKGQGGLPASIPIHAFHDFNDPIGRGAPEYRDDVLYVRGKFASTPRAQEIRSLVAEGVIANMSVGFMAPEREAKDGVTHILAAELLEASFVSVSSNREAAVLAVKGLTCPTCAAQWAAAADGAEKSVDGEDATGADPTVESTREDTSGAGGDDEQQHLELRAYALRLLAGSVT